MRCYAKLRWRLVLALLLVALPGVTHAQAPRVLECDAVSKAGIGHRLIFRLQGEQIVEYTYTSTTRDGRICDVSSDRGDSADKWRDEANKTFVEIYGLSQGAALAKVVITKKDKSYELNVVQRDSVRACAPGASISPIAILHVSKKNCDLGRED